MRINQELCKGCLIAGAYTPMEAAGPVEAPILIVTDRPTPSAARSNRLLAPQSMAEFAAAAQDNNFRKEDFRFTPMCHCPYETNDYTNKQKKAIHDHCRQHLLAEVENGSAEVIVPLGAEASTAAFGRSTKITKVRGLPNLAKDYNKPVFPLLSPGIVAKYPENRPLFVADFQSLGRFVDSGYDPANSAAVGANEGSYQIITDLQFLIDGEHELLAFDTENTGLRWYQQGCDVRTYNSRYHKNSPIFKPKFQILTMQFTVKSGESYMLVWDHPEAPIPEQDKPRLRNQLRQLLCNPATVVIGQNTKYDNVALWMTEGIRFRVGGDTLMLAALVDENALEKSLDVLTKLHVREMAGYADAFNQTVKKDRMWEVPIAKILPYGCGDTDATYRLYGVLEDIVANDAKLWQHYCQVSIPGLNAFSGIESRGMFTDQDVALAEFKAVMIADVERQRVELLGAIPRDCKRSIVQEFLSRPANKHKTAEDALKFSRPEFLKQILFTHPLGFKLTPVVFTKSTTNLNDQRQREPSVSSKDHLPYFFETCPFTQELAEYVKDSRMLGTSVIGFENKYIVGGKVRPVYRLDKTVTGRTSCVRGDTPILTDGGTVEAKDIQPGHKVWTHAGRWREVVRLYRKPVTAMYSVRFSNGEVLTCTADHRVLLNSGEWATLRSLIQKGIDHAERVQEAYSESRVGAQGSDGVQDLHEDAAGSRGRILSEHADSQGDGSALCLGRGLQKVLCLEVSREQAGGEEPSVWQSLGIRLRGWQGIPDAANGRHEVLRASHSLCRVPWGSSVAVTGHGEHPPCGREHEEQRHPQSGTDHTSGASSDTRQVPDAWAGLAIEKIDCAGSHRVYDFEVDEDHSYFACGVFSHNSEDPNGQNYPKRGVRAKAYRTMFKAPDGHYVCENDLSQAELRIAACMSNDRTMIQIYKSGGDIHKATALIVLGVTQAQFEELTKKEQKEARQKAKAVNFGFLYGMGWRKFIGYAKTQYGVTFSEQEAQRVRNGFFRKYTFLDDWHKKMRAFASKNKFVRSLSGRVRHLPMIDSSEESVVQEAGRQAINSPVQEFGSTLGVIALARMNEELDPEYIKIVGFIHDAIVYYVRKEHLAWGMRTVKRYMETNPIEELFGHRLAVPILADVGFGEDLGNIHECEGFRIDTPFDFDTLRDKEGELLIDVPAQVDPPNDGRLTRSAYTMPDDVEDAHCVFVVRKKRLVRASVSKDAVKRMDRSSRQMVINRRNRAIRQDAQVEVRRTLYRRTKK